MSFDPFDLSGRKRSTADRLAGPTAGLTLVETIVALALAALVVAFLAQGTALLRQFARLGGLVAAQDETLAVRDHLRRTIESATQSGGSHRDTFAGVGDTAVFTVPGDRLLEPGGPVRITLAVVPEGSRLSLAETRATAGTQADKGRTRRLITGAVRIAFSYYGVLGEAPVWVSEWTDPGAGPTLMRIDVAFAPDDPRRWPPFLVMIPSGGDPSATQTAAPAKPLSAQR